MRDTCTRRNIGASHPATRPGRCGLAQGREYLKPPGFKQGQYSEESGAGIHRHATRSLRNVAGPHT
ncbi:hypothetical protein PDE01_28050 [Paracoccus denitrificans]|nr:hypothetical protein PDE01_28050 [Paracoccus denitrificans]